MTSQKAVRSQVAGGPGVGADDGAAAALGQHRVQQAQAAQAQQNHEQAHETGQEQMGFDAAEELQVTQDRQAGEQDQEQRQQPGRELADDDLPAAEVGDQEKIQRSAPPSPR